jgi:uroporphyrinogen decarboxylase
MNSRERWHAVNSYGSFDRPFHWELPPFPETLWRWENEGMPGDDHLEHLVGYDRFEQLPTSVVDPCPAFHREDLEYQGEYVLYRDTDGVIKKMHRHPQGPAMPQYCRYPIETRTDWQRFKKRLNPDSPARLPLWWDFLKKSCEDRDFPFGFRAGSLFGRLRNWMGIERIALSLYDDPGWVQEMVDYMVEFFMTVLKRFIFDFQFDFAVFWEDMAYKTASLISPQHFCKFLMPGYRKITALLHQAGIQIIALDCDGYAEELIPLWLDCGINFIYPMEVAAGMDVVALRQKFGRDLRMAGGIDKRVLARGDRHEIRQMILSKKPLMLEGGYVPGVDHLIPPDVSWDSFKYYHDLINQIHS